MYTMRTKRYETRIAAQKAGERADLPADRRMVRQCADCPSSVRSKRREKWSPTIARKMAAVLDLDSAKVRAAYDAALKGDRP